MPRGDQVGFWARDSGPFVAPKGGTVVVMAVVVKARRSCTRPSLITSLVRVAVTVHCTVLHLCYSHPMREDFAPSKVQSQCL